MRYKPMPLSVVFDLKPSQKFRVFYAKDDDPADVRFDYEVFTVERNDGTDLDTDDGYTFTRTQFDSAKDNSVGMSGRGRAKFFYP